MKIYVEGPPGSGKTTQLIAIANEHHAAGKLVWFTTHNMTSGVLYAKGLNAAIRVMYHEDALNTVRVVNHTGKVDKWIEIQTPRTLR